MQPGLDPQRRLAEQAEQLQSQRVNHVKACLVRIPGQGARGFQTGHIDRIDRPDWHQNHRIRGLLTRHDQETADPVAIASGHQQLGAICDHARGAEQRVRRRTAKQVVVEQQVLDDQTTARLAPEQGQRLVCIGNRGQPATAVDPGQIGDIVQTVNRGHALHQQSGLSQSPSSRVDRKDCQRIVKPRGSIQMSTLRAEQQVPDATQTLDTTKPVLPAGDEFEFAGGRIALEQRDCIGVGAGNVDEAAVGTDHDILSIADAVGSAALTENLRRLQQLAGQWITAEQFKLIAAHGDRETPVGGNRQRVRCQQRGHFERGAENACGRLCGATPGHVEQGRRDLVLDEHAAD